MKLEVTEEDLETIIKIMQVLSAIKDREIATDNMFEPLLGIVELLKNYNVEFGVEVYEQFVVLPEKWIGLKKLALNVKNYIQPFQAYQVDLIQKRISLFNFRLRLYRENFRTLPVSTITGI